MKVSLLGPLEVHDDNGVLLDLGGSRLRTLFIRLAVEPGRTVSRDALIDVVWGDEPPDNAANALQQLISRLRRTGVPVEGISTGYQLGIAKGDIDIFADRPMPWRGQALADVADADFAQPHIARLTEPPLQPTDTPLSAPDAVGSKPASLQARDRDRCRLSSKIPVFLSSWDDNDL